MERYLFSYDEKEPKDLVVCTNSGQVIIKSVDNDSQSVFESPPMTPDQTRQVAISLIEAAAVADGQLIEDVMAEIEKTQ
jgi:hypothetical protein